MDALNTEKRKIHLKHESMETFEISMIGPKEVLVALIKRQIGKGYYKSGIFFRRSSMNPFLDIHFSLTIDI